jgi:hypothetical protein
MREEEGRGGEEEGRVGDELANSGKRQAASEDHARTCTRLCCPAHAHTVSSVRMHRYACWLFLATQYCVFCMFVIPCYTRCYERWLGVREARGWR